MLLLGVGLYSGFATAELTASQWLDRDSVAVGETVLVNLNLIYAGENASQVNVMPILPYGITSYGPGVYTLMLYPSQPQVVSYPVTAEQAGYYDVTSSISYTEYGFRRELRMVSPLVVVAQSPPAPPQGESSSHPEDNPPKDGPADQPPANDCMPP